MPNIRNAAQINALLVVHRVAASLASLCALISWGISAIARWISGEAKRLSTTGEGAGLSGRPSAGFSCSSVINKGYHSEFSQSTTNEQNPLRGHSVKEIDGFSSGKVSADSG